MHILHLYIYTFIHYTALRIAMEYFNTFVLMTCLLICILISACLSSIFAAIHIYIFTYMSDNAFACAILQISFIISNFLFSIFFSLAFSCSLTRSVSVKVFHLPRNLYAHLHTHSCKYIHITYISCISNAKIATSMPIIHDNYAI